jgi:hypothetical protein
LQYCGQKLKKWLGTEGYGRYLQKGWIHAAAAALTFPYVCACLFILANDGPSIRRILTVMVRSPGGGRGSVAARF